MTHDSYTNTNWSADAAGTRTEKPVDLDCANHKNLPFARTPSPSDPYTSNGSTAASPDQLV
ncbi:hypothetical protein RA276_28980, partial [Pseudomonas syringae pv. tagetis]